MEGVDIAGTTPASTRFKGEKEGETVEIFYRNNGLTNKRREILDRIREGNYNELSKLSQVLIPSGRYDFDAINRTGFQISKPKAGPLYWVYQVD